MISADFFFFFFLHKPKHHFYQLGHIFNNDPDVFWADFLQCKNKIDVILLFFHDGYLSGFGDPPKTGQLLVYPEWILN